jgi:peptidoglycan-associated lipoprotein
MLGADMRKKISLIKFALTFVALFMGSSAVAEETSPWTYWLGAGGYFMEGDDPNYPGGLYEGRVSYDIDPQLTVEVGIGGSPFFEGRDYGAPDPQEATFNGKNSPGENWMIKSNVGLLYHLMENDKNGSIDPYLSVMGGGAYWGKERQGNNQGAAFGGPGAGVSYWFDKDMAVRGDYSMLVTHDGDAEINHQALLLAFYRFGGEDEAVVVTDEPKGGDLGQFTSAPLKPIYFDFDKSDIRGDAKTTLAENADWMKKNASANVSLEGHCDERGTKEYNMALGERRARSAYDYVKALGVPAERLTTVSFGEEFPADPSKNEAAFAKNRRVESVIKK